MPSRKVSGRKLGHIRAVWGGNRRSRPAEESFSLDATLYALRLLYCDVNVASVRLWSDEEREAAFNWAIREKLCRQDRVENTEPRPAHIAEVTVE